MLLLPTKPHICEHQTIYRDLFISFFTLCLMNTNTKRFIALSTVAAFAAFGASSAFASQVGTGTVTGSGGLTTAINWNDTIPGSASGTINGIIVKAKVRPILNMAISADTIDLGYLNPTTYTSGSVTMEIGTNASAGASVTAKSLNGGMLSASGDILNTLVADGIAESYKWTTTLSGASDSVAAGFTQTANLSSEVNDTVTAHTLYTTNKPSKTSIDVDDFIFTVSSKISEDTPAQDYGDTVIVTVAANF